MTGVFFQAVVFYRIVENRCELIVDATQIGLGVWFPVPIAMAAQAILPTAYVCGLNFIERYLAEERGYLQIYEPFLARDGRGLEPLFHVLFVQLNEVPERHAEAGACLSYEVPFPLQRLPLSREAALFLVDDLARPILDTELSHPLVCFTVLRY